MPGFESLLANLDAKRRDGDAHADAFVSEVIEKHEIDQLNIFFKEFIYNTQTKVTDIPEVFEPYFDENSKLPDWAEPAKIRIAENLFAKSGPAFILAYFCKSLPECYACGNGAEILYKTGRLTEHTRRRVAQTAQFVLDVMSPGGLEIRGRGLVTSTKVRLMHASIRYYFVQQVRAGKIDYDIEQTGYPINQEDLLGTMLAFSHVVIEGIQKLGYRVSDIEKESVLHLWKCVGFLIGIEDVHLIENYKQSEMLWNKILDGQLRQTREGIALNDLLVEFLDEIIPGNELDDVVLIMMNHLMDENMCNILDLKKPNHKNLKAYVSYILGLLLLRLESIGFFSRIASHYVNMKLMKGLEEYIAHGEDTGIYIPPSLRSDWKIDSVSGAMIDAGGK